MNEFTLKAFDEKAEELYHHGVQGMSWGKQNGPPYPLSGINKKIARAEARQKKEKERRLEKARRAAKQKRKEEKREENRQIKIDKMKAKALNKGDLKTVSKKAKYFTNDEIQYAIQRRQALDAAKNPKSKKEIAKAEKKAAQTAKFMQNLENASFMATKIGNIAAQAKNVESLFEEVRKNKDAAKSRSLDLSNKRYQQQQTIANVVKTMQEATESRARTEAQNMNTYQTAMNILRTHDPEAATAQVRRNFGVPEGGYEAQRRSAVESYRAPINAASDWATSTSAFSNTRVSSILPETHSGTGSGTHAPGTGNNQTSYTGANWTNSYTPFTTTSITDIRTYGGH